MHFFGLLIGLAALFIIGSSFILVIRAEYYLGHLWWPYLACIGLSLIVGSLLISSMWISALMGVLGTSLIWGSTELKNQAVRAELGWYPFNTNKKPQPPFSKQIKKWRTPNL